MIYGSPSANITQKQKCYSALSSTPEYQPDTYAAMHMLGAGVGEGRNKPK